MDLMKRGLDAAIEMAEKGWSEGGIPIGSVLMTETGEIVARGHNERVQTGDPTAHAEMVCLRDLLRLRRLRYAAHAAKVHGHVHQRRVPRWWSAPHHLRAY